MKVLSSGTPLLGHQLCRNVILKKNKEKNPTEQNNMGTIMKKQGQAEGRLRKKYLSVLKQPRKGETVETPSQGISVLS